MTKEAETNSPPARHHLSINSTALKAVFILAVFTLGLGSGYSMGRHAEGEIASPTATPEVNAATAMIHQINPPDGYTIPAKFGDIGPQMVAAGAIDYTQFVQLYEESGKPLSNDELTILTKGTNSQVVINQDNAQFLLNFFWAFGLTNQNKILTEGPIMAKGIDQVENFASTGGWTIGAKPVMQLFASTMMVSLTDEQQARLLDVASTVYRPCCNNPTHFPDCNHGMAMLGLLELMASQNASIDEMYSAAKYVNAFWYPQQMLEIATLFRATQNTDFAQADASQVVSGEYSSNQGFQAVHQFLASNGLLEQAPNSGGSCGVR